MMHLCQLRRSSEWNRSENFCGSQTASVPACICQGAGTTWRWVMILHFPFQASHRVISLKPHLHNMNLKNATFAPTLGLHRIYSRLSLSLFHPLRHFRRHILFHLSIKTRARGGSLGKMLGSLIQLTSHGLRYDSEVEQMGRWTEFWRSREPPCFSD